MKCITLFLAVSGVVSLGAFGDEKLDERALVECVGKIVKHTPNGLHLNYAERGAWLGLTTIKLTSPKEWKGHELAVTIERLDEKHLLRREGKTVKFTIARIFLVKEYVRKDGTKTSYEAAEGALENLEVIEGESAGAEERKVRR